MGACWIGCRSSRVLLRPCLAPLMSHSSPVSLVPCSTRHPSSFCPSLVLPPGRFCARVVRCCANSIMPMSSPPKKHLRTPSAEDDARAKTCSIDSSRVQADTPPTPTFRCQCR
ncbi:hypothetical protein BU14_1501s0003 [Porphyra umbilicalis]|uniref:Uncharacterized protein n=1 Tax=Porphyra umbilicalis TaxID=2786 RepID=A0A1X6NLG5_PORUM|nr:hypothetical protein BU14_1501s0003 [Porphyra umbilicalis]|eukprot:OSX69454.1 hypothetical protein BU14_1501s0003 [Porphyra umbilicalis]